MRIAYFTDDLEFADRLVRLVGKMDFDMIFEIFDCRNRVDDDQRGSDGKVKNEFGISKFDLIISDALCSNEKFEVDLYITKDDKLLTLNEHYNNIIAAYRKKRGIKNPVSYEGNAKLLYFCSSAGGSGKTTVALGLSNDLCRFHDKKVLYLCMEPFDGSEFYVEVLERKKDLDEFLYRLFTKKQINIFDFLVENKYGVFSLCPTKGKNPIYDLTIEEMKSFLWILNEQGKFDYIICDGYLPLGKLEMMLMISAYKICVVESGNSDYKLNNMFSYFEKGIYIQKDKIIRIRNHFPIWAESDKDKICIVEDPNCNKVFPENKAEINTDGDFGRGIKLLCEEVA